MKYCFCYLEPVCCSLALFIVMLSKGHLTSHSRMSGSRWVITPSWFYLGHEDLLCNVLLCILATSSSYILLLLGPYHFCPLLCPSLHDVPLVSLIFLKRSLVFPILLFSSISLHDHWGRLSYPQEKEMQKSKMAVWGGLTNSCEQKRSGKQRRKGKI